MNPAMLSRRFLQYAGGSVLALLVGACSSDTAPTTPTALTRPPKPEPDADVAGRWHGGISLSASAEETAYISFTLTQAGTTVEGRFECLYRCVQSIGTVTGTVSKTAFTGRIDFPDGSSCEGFEGTVSSSTVSGRFACAGAIGTDGTASGNWGMSRESTSSCVPDLVSPAAHAILDNGRSDGSDVIDWDFDWTDCPGASYHVIVMGHTAIYPVVDEEVMESSVHRIKCGSYIVGQNMYGWRWRIRAYFNGRAGEWSREGIFDVERPDSDPPQFCE